MKKHNRGDLTLLRALNRRHVLCGRLLSLTLNCCRGSLRLRELYAKCRALIMPGEEDFGMVAVEALASGKPVIGLGHGGVCEAVHGESNFGILYSGATEQDLADALRQFEAWQIRSNVEGREVVERMQRSVQRFSERTFAENMRAAVLGSAAAVARG